MSTLVEVDRSLEAAATLADALEEQLGHAYVTRIRLVTWIIQRFENPQSLEKAADELPVLDGQLRLDYEQWRRG